ncbi:UNVERIFIED_CONTAM: hypothetical protein Slati_3275300 [Sesamum latifolium]|uniref:Uncharacterized protein n=1 Tax=Sesamum latifolium TaxID=2727402 RepID=A0AAW2UZG4_9LAMI
MVPPRHQRHHHIHQKRRRVARLRRQNRHPDHRLIHPHRWSRKATEARIAVLSTNTRWSRKATKARIAVLSANTWRWKATEARFSFISAASRSTHTILSTNPDRPHPTFPPVKHPRSTSSRRRRRQQPHHHHRCVCLLRWRVLPCIPRSRPVLLGQEKEEACHGPRSCCCL